MKTEESVKNNRVVGYFRASTGDSSANQRIEAEKKEYELACETQGWTNIKMVEDIGMATSIKDREGIQKILVLADEGQVDKVWVSSLDRLIRPDNPQDMVEIRDVFLKNGVELCVPNRLICLGDRKDIDNIDLAHCFKKILRIYGDRKEVEG